MSQALRPSPHYVYLIYKQQKMSVFDDRSVLRFALRGESFEKISIKGRLTINNNALPVGAARFIVFAIKAS